MSLRLQPGCPDGALVATSSNDQTVCLCESATGDPLATLEGHTDSVWEATFRPDGARLATGSEDGTLRVWDPAGRRQLAIIKCFGGYSVQSATYSPDGTLTTAGSVRLWAPQ